MAKPKTEEILRQQKDAKLKKVLIVLAPIFLLLMVWQGPGYVKMLTGGDEPVATPSETPTVPSGPTPDPSTAPPPSTTTPGGAPTPPTSADSPAALADSDQPAPADSGQLISFDRFVGKDPFRQIVDTDATDDASTGGTVTPLPTNPGGGGGTGGNGSGSGGGGSDPDARPVSAVLEVNGVKERVELEGAFPEGDELFDLAKLSRRSAWIGLVAGEYSNGKETIEVKLGKKLSLVSQPDGIRYTIKLVRVILA
jgi:hypothetical protein